MYAASRAQQGLILYHISNQVHRFTGDGQNLDTHQQLLYTGHMTPSTIRSFFACPITKENLARIDELLSRLKNSSPDNVKWVSTKNMHLTIKFIGEFKPNDIIRIQDLLQNALSSFRPFDLKIRKMGAFPSQSKPGVIWLGIEPENSLYDLVKIVNFHTEKLGYPSEKRPFSAHITLGRVKPNTSSSDLHGISDLILSFENVEIGSQSVDNLIFFKSDLMPAGPVYQALFKLAF